ncbi:MAG: GFA family protein, partial [Pseudomonadota bacterium]
MSETASAPLFTGRCYCGAITLEATAAPLTAAYCHCADCRRWTGAPVAAFAAFAADTVRLTPEPGFISA